MAARDLARDPRDHLGQAQASALSQVAQDDLRHLDLRAREHRPEALEGDVRPDVADDQLLDHEALRALLLPGSSLCRRASEQRAVVGLPRRALDGQAHAVEQDARDHDDVLAQGAGRDRGVRVPQLQEPLPREALRVGDLQAADVDVSSEEAQLDAGDLRLHAEGGAPAALDGPRHESVDVEPADRQEHDQGQPGVQQCLSEAAHGLASPGEISAPPGAGPSGAAAR